ncbi:uncharacterized protein LOC131949933 [Physella acuta]|uniref:uncharacterized protein LOC131949933 n=1 Tax=Physella acuta TaxID=109671 RepID=UPI0027DBA32C|nr:uncharacterized protein LOC131949933 [Physella acuta]
MWTDGTKANLTSLWHVDEPNDQEGNEDCLELYDFGMLNDDDCAKSFSFICMELHETTATPTTSPTTYSSSTATLSFTTARNESKLKNVSSDSLATNAAPETYLTTYPPTKATHSITTERNESKLNNDVENSLGEKHDVLELEIIVSKTFNISMDTFSKFA